MQKRSVSILKLIVLVYGFILSIELIKNISLLILPHISNTLTSVINSSPIKALSFGWIITTVLQSGGLVSAIIATFVGNNIINYMTGLYILMGTVIGATITSLLVCFLIKPRRKKDFRHGFEIALSYVIFSLTTMILVFVLEYFFGIFSWMITKLNSVFVDGIFIDRFPNFIEIITKPITDLELFTSYPGIGLIVAILLLFFSLEFISKAVIEVFGGENKTRKMVHQYFDNKWSAFLIGMGLTAICLNSNVTIGLLVPLAAARLVKLYQVIPYIIGAKIGTVTDTILSALIVGKASALSLALVYASFGIIGALIWLPQTGNLFKITKYLSKQIIKVSKTRFIIFIGLFILIPLLLILLIH